MRWLIILLLCGGVAGISYAVWPTAEPVEEAEPIASQPLSAEEQLLEVSEHLLAPDLYLSLWLAPEEAHTDAFSRMVYGVELVNLVSSKCWTTDSFAANNALFATLISADAIADVGTQEAFDRLAVLQSYAQADAAVLLHLGCDGVIKDHLLMANMHLDSIFQSRLEDTGLADAYRQVTEGLFGLINNLKQ